MIRITAPDSLISWITHSHLAVYAEVTGWTIHQQTVKYRVCAKNEEQVVIPTEPKLGDYRRRIVEAIEAFAAVEGRSGLEVINDIKREYFIGATKFILAKPSI